MREKKCSMWNAVVERANVDFEGNRKEFWSFVSRRTKCKKKVIASLRSDKGVSVTSKQGKLEVLRKHYEHLGKSSVNSVFDTKWKEYVDGCVNGYSKDSVACDDTLLDRGIGRR